MNLLEIDKAIEELENGETTYTACQKLSSLYIVRDHLKPREEDKAIAEYEDILPSYTIYKDPRTRYCLGEISERAVEEALALLCIEIKEFINTLYCTTDNSTQRQCIADALESSI